MILKVELKYRDDSSETVDCCDLPAIGQDWITLYVKAESALRRVIRTERISEVSYWWEPV